ncbi:Imelysin [Owenweeksia hongkongensis DSM 17368]|uniref:Imelysin n=1 Tax=Owenweeksia hongkongensis (strain DSM 17368 / CIP 108786 / JCM 12287 / NRRL B-23963 / UST20020801) TaxID=926562 RepID=G8QZA9_OWEHD|nr:imelysin family protein [Owenweeksia hongkongensis]AEV32537.1 Imelysin [Owenweeksia hongkongensis DSM 17368]
MIQLKPTLAILALLTLFACGKEDEKDKDPVDNFNRKELFTNLGDKVVLPTFLEFVNTSDSLFQKALAFQNQPSTNTLTELQTAWVQAKTSSKKIEQLKFGPLNDTKMYSLVDKWATNDGFIEGFISGTDPINNSFINGKGATSKGLPAIEYLIFKNGDNATVLSELSSNSRRVDYVVACCENLSLKALEIASFWSPLGDNYLGQYSANTGGGLDGSLSQTVNQMSSHIEFMTVTKVGKPLGKELNTGIRTSQLEAYISETSKEALIANIKIFKSLFTGTENNTGFDDYLDYLGAMKDGKLLSTAILEQADLVQSNLENMNGSLSNELTSSPQNVEELYQNLKALLVLVKTDMTSALSVTLTFSDNDGD